MTDEASLDLTPPTKKGGGKKKAANGEAKADAPAKEKAPSSRAKLSKQYPEDAKLTLLAESNPKKPGSAAHGIFEFYKNAATVGDFFAASANFEHNGKKRPGSYADITYDVGHGYIKVG